MATTKRYIVTIVVDDKSGKGWSNVQIGEVVKSVPALKKVIAQAKPLSKYEEYTVWTMTYHSNWVRNAYLDTWRELKEDTYSRTGRLVHSRDRSGDINTVPRSVPKFPSFEEVGLL